MTQKEKEIIEGLVDTVNYLRRDIEHFKEGVTKKTDFLKSLPVNLERQIVDSMNVSISQSINKILVDDYNSPLKLLINKVVMEYETSIKDTMSKILKQSIEKEELEGELKKALIQKISRSIINGIDGGVDKVVNQLKNDPIFKSELLLAVNNIVTRFNKKEV